MAPSPVLKASQRLLNWVLVGEETLGKPLHLEDGKRYEGKVRAEVTDPLQVMLLSEDVRDPLTQGHDLNVLRPQHDVLRTQLSKVTLNCGEELIFMRSEFLLKYEGEQMRRGHQDISYLNAPT